MKKSYFLLTVMLFLVVTGVWFSVSAGAEEKTLSGKDFVRLGKPGSVSGILQEQAGEWYLKAKNEVFALHFGNQDYRAKTGIQLESGKNAAVQGFVYGKDITVCTITIDKKKYEFRKADGTPLWSGSGNNQNSQVSR